MQRIRYSAITLGVLLLDAWTKWLVHARIGLYDAIPVIPDLFDLVHVRNTGAAFGIGANADSRLVPFLLNGGAIAVFCVVLAYAYRTAATERMLQVALHLILGGAIGNLIDRFRLGYVVDFLDFYVTIGGERHQWPAFNIADSAICIGIALLFVDMWLKPRSEDADVGPVQHSA